jgi:hypothetical protein
MKDREAKEKEKNLNLYSIEQLVTEFLKHKNNNQRSFQSKDKEKKGEY